MSFADKRLIGIVIAVALLLMVPVLAMKFTDGFDWSIGDFAVATALLLGSGLACEIVLRSVRRIEHRLLLCAAVLIVLFVIWAELAVGLIGTPLAGS